MAYMDQELKKRLALKIKPILKKYDIKGTLSVRHYYLNLGQLIFKLIA